MTLAGAAAAGHHGTMQLLLSPMLLLMNSPWLACLLGAVFLVRARSAPSRRLTMAGSAFLLYGLYETVMYHWSTQVVAPIRVDLLVIMPLLYLAAGVGVTAWFAPGHPAGEAQSAPQARDHRRKPRGNR
ncbi:MAG: hypothetical protein HY319_23200 [Armatimonadetes bacterium]|nr:hypothetical protein [Armatimonadota bacterium]